MKYYLEREKTGEIVEEFEEKDRAEISAAIWLFGFGEFVRIIESEE